LTQEILELISEVQQHQSELDNIEVKSAHKGTLISPSLLSQIAQVEGVFCLGWMKSAIMKSSALTIHNVYRKRLAS